MKENNFVSKARRRFRVTTKTDSTAKAAPNKLGQNFVSNIPNENGFLILHTFGLLLVGYIWL